MNVNDKLKLVGHWLDQHQVALDSDDAHSLRGFQTPVLDARAPELALDDHCSFRIKRAFNQTSGADNVYRDRG